MRNIPVIQIDTPVREAPVKQPHPKWIDHIFDDDQDENTDGCYICGRPPNQDPCAGCDKKICEEHTSYWCVGSVMASHILHQNYYERCHNGCKGGFPACPMCSAKVS